MGMINGKKLGMCLAYLVFAWSGTILSEIGWNTYSFETYVIPLVWCAMAFGQIYFGTNERTYGRRSNYSVFYGIAFWSALVLISSRILAGAFLDGFAASPYDRSLSGIVMNVFALFPQLFVREHLRSSLLAGVNSFRKKRTKWLLVTGITLFFICLQINFTKLFSLSGSENIVVYVFQVMLPLVVENILLDFFAINGGYFPAFLYAGILTAFEWFFPVIPNLNWLTDTVLNICIPAFFLFRVIDKGEFLAGERKVRKPEKECTTWITLIACVGIIWFFAGVFPIYPSVVLTGSMEPGIYPGDMVLVEKIKSEDALMKLKVGDVINFQRDAINISHRIVAVKEDEDGNRVFQTKGDNNSSEDVRKVKLTEVKGIIRFQLPKVGLPVLWLKGSKESIQRQVEF